jgi:hypothetical protein
MLLVPAASPRHRVAIAYLDGQMIVPGGFLRQQRSIRVAHDNLEAFNSEVSVDKNPGVIEVNWLSVWSLSKPGYAIWLGGISASFTTGECRVREEHRRRSLSGI